MAIEYNELGGVAQGQGGASSLEEQIEFLDTLIFGRHEIKGSFGQLHTLNNDALILRNNQKDGAPLGEGWEGLCYDNFQAYESKADIPEDAPGQWYVFVVDGWDDYSGKLSVAAAHVRAMGMCSILPDDMRAVAVVGDTLVPSERMEEELSKHGLKLLAHLDFREGQEHHINPLVDGGYVRKDSSINTLVLWKGVSDEYSDLFSERELVVQHYISLCLDAAHLLGKDTYSYEEMTRRCFDGDFVSAMAAAVETASFGTQSLPERAIRDAAPRNPGDRKRTANSRLRDVLFVPDEGPARQIAEVTAVRPAMMRAWYALASSAHLAVLPPDDGLPRIPEFLPMLIEAAGLQDDFEEQLREDDNAALLDKISEIRGPMMGQPSPEQRQRAAEAYAPCIAKEHSHYETRELQGVPSGACEIIAAIESSLNPSKLGFKATHAPSLMLFGCDDPAGTVAIVKTPCHDFPKVCEIYNELFPDDGWSLVVAPPMTEDEQESLGLCAVALGKVRPDHRKLVVACGHWELLPDWKLEGWTERFAEEGIDVVGDLDGVLENYDYESCWEESDIERVCEDGRWIYALSPSAKALPEVADAVSEAMPAKLLSAFRGARLPFFSLDITWRSLRALALDEDGKTLPSDLEYPDPVYIDVTGQPYPMLPMLSVFPAGSPLVKEPGWAPSVVEYRELAQLWNAALEPLGMRLDMATRHRCFSLLSMVGDLCGVGSFIEAHREGIPISELLV